MDCPESRPQKLAPISRRSQEGTRLCRHGPVKDFFFSKVSAWPISLHTGTVESDLSEISVWFVPNARAEC